VTNRDIATPFIGKGHSNPFKGRHISVQHGPGLAQRRQNWIFAPILILPRRTGCHSAFAAWCRPDARSMMGWPTTQAREAS